MAQATGIQTNFTAGEMSPILFGRSDLQDYYNGSATLENWIPLKQGGIQRRPGTRYAANTKNDAASILLAFKHLNIQSYVLEMGDSYLRFFRDGEQVMDDGSLKSAGTSTSPYELASPFTASLGISLVWTTQNDSVLYFFHPRVPPRELVRIEGLNVSAASWAAGSPARVTLTIGPHDIEVGAKVIVTGVSPGSYNGCYVVSVSDQTNGTIKYDLVSDPGAYTSGGAVEGFQITEHDPQDGPFLPVNTNESHTITASATTGSGITITSSSDLFRATDVGRQIRLKMGQRTIDSFSSADGGTKTHVDSPFHGLSTGDTIQIFGTISYNGTHTITKIDDGKMRINVAFESDESQSRSEIIEVNGGGATGGTFTLSHEGNETSAINFNDAASVVETELEGLSSITSVSVAGGPLPAVVTVTFDGADANKDMSDVTVSDDSTTGGSGVTATATQEGIDGSIVSWLAEGSDTTWGYVKVTGFTDAKNVTADVVNELGGVVATSLWRLGAWSDTSGWPWVGEFAKGRLWAAATDTDPNTAYGSVSGEYNNYQPSATDGLVVDSDAVAHTLVDESANAIYWLASTRDGILVGTQEKEWVIASRSTLDPLTTTSIASLSYTNEGSSRIARPRIKTKQGQVVFLQGNGSKLIELTFQDALDNVDSRDLSARSEHLGRPGIVDMAYQKEPNSLIWMVRSDGKMSTITYEPSENVISWAGHVLGGNDVEVESVASELDESGTTPIDRVWVVVKRTVDSATVRHVEYFEAMRNEGDDIEDAFYVDSGITYDGAATSTITGLDHLEGETVRVVADGEARSDTVVASGQITLQQTGSKVHVGLGYSSRHGSMPITINDPNAINRVTRSGRVTTRFMDTLGVSMGNSETNLDKIEFRKGADFMDKALTPFTGLETRPFGSSYARDVRFWIVADSALPATVLSIMYELDIENRS